MPDLLRAGNPVDLDAENLSVGPYQMSLGRGATLDITQSVEHTSPTFGLGDEVRYELDDGTTVFLGDVLSRDQAGNPGQETITYHCSGLRARARLVWAERDGIPRLTYNLRQEDEERDDAFVDMTVGEIIADLFDTHDTLLRDAGAAPAVGNIYTQNDLDAMTAVPGPLQLDTQNFDEAIQAVLRTQPQFRYVIDANTQRWTFFRPADSALATYTPTYNSTADPDSRPLSSLVSPSLGDGRYTAVRIVGAREPTCITLYLSNNELTPLWDSSLENQWSTRVVNNIQDRGSVDSSTVTTITDTSKDWDPGWWVGARVIVWVTTDDQLVGTVTANTTDTLTIDGEDMTGATGLVYQLTFVDPRDNPMFLVFRYFQVTDTAKRRINRVISGAPGCESLAGRCAQVRMGNQLPNGEWSWSEVPAFFDWNNGIFWTRAPLINPFASNPFLPGQSQLADDVSLTYEYLGEPLTARSPSSGFSGTAFTLFGLQRELVRYEPSWKTVNNQTAWETVAAGYLETVQDVLWKGSVPSLGQEWGIRLLQRRVNIAEVDDSGASVTTGFESINAVLHSVAIDPSTNRTSINLGADPAVFGIGSRISRLEERLRTAETADLNAATLMADFKALVRRASCWTSPSPDGPPPAAGSDPAVSPLVGDMDGSLPDGEIGTPIMDLVGNPGLRGLSEIIQVEDVGDGVFAAGIGISGGLSRGYIFDRRLTAGPTLIGQLRDVLAVMEDPPVNILGLGIDTEAIFFSTFDESELGPLPFDQGITSGPDRTPAASGLGFITGELRRAAGSNPGSRWQIAVGLFEAGGLAGDPLEWSGTRLQHDQNLGGGSVNAMTDIFVAKATVSATPSTHSHSVHVRTRSISFTLGHMTGIGDESDCCHPGSEFTNSAATGCTDPEGTPVGACFTFYDE